MYRVSEKSSPKEIIVLLLYLWKFKIASKTNSNTKMPNYKFVLQSVRVRMVQLTTEQRVFVATTYALTQSVTEVLNYLDDGKL
jgi:hypothetical protein